jgi:hypothetical protein
VVNGAESAEKPTDAELADQLTDCYNGLTALEAISLLSKAKVDSTGFAKSKRLAKMGSISLIGDEKAKEVYEASKEKVKAEMAAALDGGSPKVVAFVERYIALCSAPFEQHGTYIAERIAAEQRLRSGKNQ